MVTRQPDVPGGEVVGEDAVLRVDDAELRHHPAEADVAPDRGRGPSGAGADDDPGRHGMAFQRHLLEDRLGDVVVAPPVGGPLGVRELIDVQTTALRREPRRFGVDGRGVGDDVAPTSLLLDQGQLLRRDGRRDDGDEGQVEHASEVRLADRRGSGRGLDDRDALVDPPVAEPIEEQRARQPVLQRARRMGGLVLQVEVDAPGRTAAGTSPGGCPPSVARRLRCSRWRRAPTDELEGPGLARRAHRRDQDRLRRSPGRQRRQSAPFRAGVRA